MPIGLYIHVPFCASKCGYCDFYSHVPSPGSMAGFLDALLDELDSDLAVCDTRIETLFIGGGTPTLLSLPLLRRLMERLGRLVLAHQPVEFTVEANPASLDADKARLLRDHGVNRISMGAQSFHAEELAVLERLHGPADLEPSVEIVRQAGFPRLNLDLIFGIPGQSLESWQHSLDRAIGLRPDHLACYGLTYEPETTLQERLAAGRVQPVPDDREAEMYLAAIDRLAAAGLNQYEISNFARPGCESRHNLRYWHNEPTLGIGPSAASYIGGRRWRNLPDTAEYVRRVRACEPIEIDEEELSPHERAGETAMLQLRLNDGIDVARFQQSTGFDPLVLFAEVIQRFADRGLLVTDAHRIALTREGRLLANRVLADFLAPSGLGPALHLPVTAPLGEGAGDSSSAAGT